VTLLAGDNGSGKSTVVEAIADAMGFASEGGELERAGELPAVPRATLGGALHPVLGDRRPRTGFFLRAESFFNVAGFVDSGDRFAPDLALYGGTPLQEQSHGESFLALAANRFGGESLYILDEPEAALSVTGAPALSRRGGMPSPGRDPPVDLQALSPPAVDGVASPLSNGQEVVVEMKRSPSWLERRRTRKRLQREARGDTSERARERAQRTGETPDSARDAKQASIGGTVNGL
jgi:hypothetical protein